MGDFKAEIQIQMKLLGKTYQTSMSINYWPDDDGVDPRVSRWFEDCFCDAKARYDITTRRVQNG